TCSSNTATSFTFNVNYSISGGVLPAGAHLVVYLSPNNGAINNNANGDTAGYVATVESNETTVSMAGLSGSGTLSFTLPVSHPFQLSGGGVLGVFASDLDGVSVWNSKTNSPNCSQASTATPTPTPPH